MTRRGILGWLAGMFGVGGTVVTASAAKIVSADPETTIIVLELADGCEGSQDDFERMYQKLQERLPGFKCLIVPHGIKVKAVYSGVVYQREELGEYSYEICAKTEEDLQRRWNQLHPGKVPER